MVANGHHWDARWPEPGFPGEFAGEELHVHHYRTPDVFVDKRVVVLGIGNSATDIAVESSRVAAATYLAMRRGAHILPKYIFGMPTDHLTDSPLARAPIALQSLGMRVLLRVAVGKMTDYGLPKPDHAVLHAHPTISGDLLTRLGHGDITVKPSVARFDGPRVEFTDGSSVEADVVAYCTGYRVSFPFLDESFAVSADNHIDLYRRVVSVDHPGLYFVGLIQPIGPVMPLAEQQAHWVADLITAAAACRPRRRCARRSRRTTGSWRSGTSRASGTPSRSMPAPTRPSCSENASERASDHLVTSGRLITTVPGGTCGGGRRWTSSLLWSAASVAPARDSTPAEPDPSTQKKSGLTVSWAWRHAGGVTTARIPQEERTRAMRARLLEATVECLVERGWSGTSTTVVSQRAGVSRGAQLHHFPTKNALVLAAVEHLSEARGAELRSAAETLPVGPRHIRAVLGILAGHFTSPIFTAALELWVAARTDAQLLAAVGPLEQRLGRDVHRLTVDLLGVDESRPGARELVQATLDLVRGLGLANTISDDRRRRNRILDAWADLLDVHLAEPA